MEQTVVGSVMGPVMESVTEDVGAAAQEREVLTWQEFGTASRYLAARVRASGYAPDLVLAVARGGLGLGMALGYALDVKALASVNVEFYTGVDQRLPEPQLLPPVPTPADLTERRVLLVDDVADTGLTLAHVRDLCAPHVSELRTAVLYDKPRSVVRPDFAWRTTSAWIDFPWSSGPWPHGPR